MQMLLPFLALLSGGAPQVSTNLSETPEIICVYDDMLAQSRTPGAQIDADAGGERCKTRYGWTAHQAQIAVHIAWARIGYLKALGEANDWKMDLDALDAIFGQLSSAQVKSCGWAEEPHDPPPAETLQAISLLAAGRFSDSAQQVKALEVLVRLALLKNSEDAFTALRRAG